MNPLRMREQAIWERWKGGDCRVGHETLASTKQDVLFCFGRSQGTVRRVVVVERGAAKLCLVLLGCGEQKKRAERRPKMMD